MGDKNHTDFSSYWDNEKHSFFLETSLLWGKNISQHSTVKWFHRNATDMDKVDLWGKQKKKMGFYWLASYLHRHIHFLSRLTTLRMTKTFRKVTLFVEFQIMSNGFATKVFSLSIFSAHSQLVMTKNLCDRVAFHILPIFIPLAFITSLVKESILQDLIFISSNYVFSILIFNNASSNIIKIPQEY